MIDKNLSEFSRDRTRPDGHFPQCKRCRSEYRKSARGRSLDLANQKERRLRRPGQQPHQRTTIARNVSYVTEIKSKPCTDCGNSFPACCMDFDHVRGEKKMNVASMAWSTLSLATIQAEIDKCDLVCANCHRIRTFNRGR